MILLYFYLIVTVVDLVLLNLEVHIFADEGEYTAKEYIAYTVISIVPLINLVQLAIGLIALWYRLEQLTDKRNVYNE